MKLFSLLDVNYKSYITRVEAYLSKTLSDFKKSFGTNTIFGQTINVVGSAIQNIMLYIEDSLVEQNKYTAQRKKSIWGLASLSGYNADLGKAAVANLELSQLLSNDNINTIILNNKTQLTCTQNGLIYTLLLPQEKIILDSSKDSSNKYFSAVQGVFENQRYISTGGQLYTVSINYVGNVDIEYLKVFVNNELWEYAPSVYDMYADGKQYTYKNGINGGIEIIFGNGAHGRPLFANDIVDVEYLIHDGVNGNVNPEEETFFVFNESLIDTEGVVHDGNELFKITFSDKDPIISGSDAESLYNVKEMIGLNSRSLVLASPENYKLLIKRFGFCGYNKTWSDSTSIKSLIIKNYAVNVTNGNEYFKLTEDDFLLSHEQYKSIYDYIESCGSQLASAKYEIVEPVLKKYAVWVYVTLKGQNQNKEIIKGKIRERIGDFFTNHMFSDKFIPKSDIIHLLKNEVSGIDGVDIYFISKDNEEALFYKEYTEDTVKYNELTGQYEKTNRLVKIYDGENPNLGLDLHGNIYLSSEFHFPVLMGGWSYIDVNGNRSETIKDPLTIIFED